MPSSVIASYSYSEEDKVLKVIFLSGLIYDYLDVPLAVYQRMLQAGMNIDADIGLMDAEIGILVDIAQGRPEKCEKIASLIGQWRDLMEKVRTVH